MWAGRGSDLAECRERRAPAGELEEAAGAGARGWGGHLEGWGRYLPGRGAGGRGEGASGEMVAVGMGQHPDGPGMPGKVLRCGPAVMGGLQKASSSGSTSPDQTRWISQGEQGLSPTTPTAPASHQHPGSGPLRVFHRHRAHGGEAWQLVGGTPWKHSAVVLHKATH